VIGEIEEIIGPDCSGAILASAKKIGIDDPSDSSGYRHHKIR